MPSTGFHQSLPVASGVCARAVDGHMLASEEELDGF
jgi:hypothetical protein